MSRHKKLLYHGRFVRKSLQASAFFKNPLRPESPRLVVSVRVGVAMGMASPCENISGGGGSG